MFIVTLLSAYLCGANAQIPEGECETAKSQMWEANSYTEAEQDWQSCLIARKAAKLSGKYDEVECDQFDPNQKVSF
jgi:hypothetical protein